MDYSTDIFEALDLQEELQIKYTGGTVFHGFIGEAIENWKSCRNLVKTIASNYRIPYFTVSPTFSVCPVHGYLKGEHFTCYKCRDEERRKIVDQIEKLKRERSALVEGNR